MLCSVPFSNMTLFEPITDAQKVQILAVHGRTPTTIQPDIDAIKAWFQKQPHLPETPSDKKILNFLLLNKFSVEKTKKKLDMYYTIRRKVPELFDVINPNGPQMQAYSDYNYFVPLPKFTPDLCRVSLCRMSGNPDLFNPIVFFAWVLNVSEIRLEQDYCSSNMIVIDLGNVGLGHLTKTTPALIKKATLISEKVYTSSIKGLHYINAPSIVDHFLRIVKTLVSPKVASRIFVHNDLVSLYEFVPKEILPKDYGGEEPLLEEIHADFQKEMAKNKEYFDRLYSLRTDESQRSEKLADDELFGFEGNFKKLDVD